MKLLGFGIELSSITEDKIEKIRHWRNHPDIMRVMLDRKAITAPQQQAWFGALPNREDRLYLMIRYKGEDIGVVSAHSLDIHLQSSTLPLHMAETISPGLYIAPDSQYKSSVLAFSPSLVFIDYLFKQGCCTVLNAQVFDYNDSAIRYNKMLGYQSGVVDEQGLLTMTLNRDNFESAKQQLSKILRF